MVDNAKQTIYNVSNVMEKGRMHIEKSKLAAKGALATYWSQLGFSQFTILPRTVNMGDKLGV